MTVVKKNQKRVKKATRRYIESDHEKFACKHCDKVCTSASGLALHGKACRGKEPMLNWMGTQPRSFKFFTQFKDDKKSAAGSLEDVKMVIEEKNEGGQLQEEE